MHTVTRKIVSMPIILGILFFVSPVMAQDGIDRYNNQSTNRGNNEVKPHGVLFAGLEFGGDMLIKAIFADGDTSTIDAGEGLYIAGGAAFPMNQDGSLETQLTFGLKMAFLQEADNGGADFTRFPLEAMLFHTSDRFRVGGGLSYHLNPTLNTDGILSSFQTDFEDSLGAVFQMDWYFAENVTVGLRYTSIDYTVDGVPGELDGSSFGLTVGARFN